MTPTLQHKKVCNSPLGLKLNSHVVIKLKNVLKVYEVFLPLCGVLTFNIKGQNHLSLTHHRLLTF
jgi:hypothetical protein